MSILKRRNRMVSFRLSEDEYAGLRNVCLTEGARSVSDLARDAVHRLIGKNGASAEVQLQTTVQTLAGRMEELDREVKRLAQMVEGRAAAGAA